MNKEMFHRKLVAALLRSGLHTQAGDSSQDGVAADRGEVLSSIRAAAGLPFFMSVVLNRDDLQKQLFQ